MMTIMMVGNYKYIIVVVVTVTGCFCNIHNKLVNSKAMAMFGIFNRMVKIQPHYLLQRRTQVSIQTTDLLQLHAGACTIATERMIYIYI